MMDVGVSPQQTMILFMFLKVVAAAVLVQLFGRRGVVSAGEG